MSTTDGKLEAPGFKLGHWTHPSSLTGCTVLLADELAPAAVDVRGGSPGTRETALLGSGMMVQGVDAVLLTGGSAFGLSAADGVVAWLRERGRGYVTRVTPVPIVSAAVIFDLTSSDSPIPDAGAGYSAAQAASETWSGGQVGGGAGAAVSKALGRNFAERSGVGVAQVECPSGVVSAVFVNNAFGDVVDDQSGRYLTTPRDQGRTSEELALARDLDPGDGEHTVIGALVVSCPLDHDGLTRVAVAGQAGLARVIRPANTPSDGDTVFALAPGRAPVSSLQLLQLTTAAQIATARALISAVKPLPGLNQFG